MLCADDAASITLGPLGSVPPPKRYYRIRPSKRTVHLRNFSFFWVHIIQEYALIVHFYGRNFEISLTWINDLSHKTGGVCLLGHVCLLGRIYGMSELGTELEPVTEAESCVAAACAACACITRLQAQHACMLP